MQSSQNSRWFLYEYITLVPNHKPVYLSACWKKPLISSFQFNASM